MACQLEVIAFNIESCITIERCGAHRIELCMNPEEGGTTPSYGFIRSAREKVSIELFPIIRPRGGSFYYSDDEFEMMKEDVRLCKELGCDGVVLGLLEMDSQVDIQRTRRLVDLAYPLEVTFHRAFDRVQDHQQALEDVIACGCTRILTSGLRPTAEEGVDILKELIEQADSRIVIMPGSGVRASNILSIAEVTGAQEFHTSARTSTSRVESRNRLFPENFQYVIADSAEIVDCIEKLSSIAMER